MRDKPTFDRAAELRRARIRCRIRGHIEQLAALLAEGETLGRPYRLDDRIVVPVVEAPSEDPLPPDGVEEAHAFLLTLMPVS